MSTEPSHPASAGGSAGADEAAGDAEAAVLNAPWMLSPQVALRPEPFGALAYHFGNRRLTFLKRPELVDVVRGLAAHDDARSALEEAGVTPAGFSAYAAALRGLAASDTIRRRDVPGAKEKP